MNSQFGRPFPRHGLQLLFWFAKDCVICELVQCVVIMKLVSDCHPEKGCFGFHLFGNVEELLPVLDRRRKHKKQVAYYEVGNLNTETYPASEDLPAYVTQNYGINGDYNTDRIIIGYQVRSRVVETIYITKHNGDFSGSFSPDDTYEISSELIRALQCPHMDLPSFLTQMGFYQDIPVVKYCDADVIHEQTEQLFDIFDTFAGFKETTQQSDAFGFFSEIHSAMKKGCTTMSMCHHTTTDLLVTVMCNMTAGHLKQARDQELRGKVMSCLVWRSVIKVLIKKTRKRAEVVASAWLRSSSVLERSCWPSDVSAG
uniref:Uncharacterized LOC110001301 n=1 Tax=Labrus bergylta TaxID=56723 RepID=A0A3Q3GII1_9LABR|nr:uncharacterized protein LOC110001301 [Labrus bergylta]XP_020512426.1 uncharacterized protein LOC110001301 [Labrus bergylta]